MLINTAKLFGNLISFGYFYCIVNQLKYKDMKKLVRVYNQSTTNYRLFPNGVEYLEDVESYEDMHDRVVNYYESDNCFIEDGPIESVMSRIVEDSSGNVVFMPNYPESFDFTDYIYALK